MIYRSDVRPCCGLSASECVCDAPWTEADDREIIKMRRDDLEFGTSAVRTLDVHRPLVIGSGYLSCFNRDDCVVVVEHGLSLTVDELRSRLAFAMQELVERLTKGKGA